MLCIGMARSVVAVKAGALLLATYTITIGRFDIQFEMMRTPVDGINPMLVAVFVFPSAGQLQLYSLGRFGLGA